MSRRIEEKQMLAKNDATRQYVDWFDVKEASDVIGITPMAVKTATRKKTLKAVRIQFPGYVKWLIDPDAAQAYQARSSTPSGYRRYILRVDPE